MHHRKGASQPAMFLSLHDIAVSQNASSVWFASRWSMLKRSLVVSSQVASQMSTPVASTQDEPMDFEKGGLCLATVDQVQDSQWVSTAKHWPYGVSALGALDDTEISGRHIVRTVFCDV